MKQFSNKTMRSPASNGAGKLFSPTAIILSLFIGGFLLTTFISPSSVSARISERGTSADAPYYTQTKQQFEDNLEGPSKTEVSLERTTSTLFTSLNNLLGIALAGYNQETVDKYNVYNPGAISIASSLVTTLISNPPISTTEYIADLGSSLGFAKPAYAQEERGLGWEALAPVLSVWKAFRNVAYLLFVIIFVVIGFMIMFRAKINPQTVISIEAAIPNLIITLILITFSYAIASLMIDLIYVFIYLAVGIFSLAGVLQDKGTATLSLFFNNNVLQLGWQHVFIDEPASAIGRLVSSMISTTQAQTGEVEGTTLSTLVAAPLREITHGLAFVIIAAAILFSMFKVFFQLLISYIGIILAVIFAPFQILFNALPGSNSFLNWLKGLLANILVFPTVALMFLLAAILIGPAASEWKVSNEVGVSAPGETTVWQPPLLQVGTQAKDVMALIALGFIILTPKAVKMVKDSLKIEKGAGYGGYAMGQVLGMPGTAIGTPINTYMQYAQMRYYMGMLQRQPEPQPGFSAPPGVAHPGTG